MKIKVNSPVLDYENKPLKEPTEDGKTTVVLWKSVIYNALNAVLKDEPLTAEDTVRCYQICGKVYQSDEPDLTPGELTFTLERIKKIFKQPIIIGRSMEFFDSPDSGSPPAPEETTPPNDK